MEMDFVPLTNVSASQASVDPPAQKKKMGLPLNETAAATGVPQEALWRTP